MRPLAVKVLRRLQSGYERWLDASLDRSYGIDTVGVHAGLAALGANGERLAAATGYDAIQIPVFRAMMRAAGVEPARHAFVDFGCGKGRALVLAAEHGFRRVVGVELAPSLYQTARDNLEAYRRRSGSAVAVELHCGDAAELPIPDGDVVLYLYHPFGEAVMRKVAANIARACRSRARSFVVAYRNPVHGNVFEELGWLRLVTRNRSFAIYA